MPDGRFHRRGDRAGIGHVVAQVRHWVDARDHQIHLGNDPKDGERHTVRGRTVAGQSRGTVGKPHLFDAQGPVNGLDMAAPRPVVIGREDADLAERAHLLGKRQQTRGGDAVVVGNQNVHILLFMSC
jgi:hypothetical protein